MKFSDKLGATICLLRQDSGITKRALSQATGIGESQIAAYEKGSMEPTLLTFERLCAGLGLSPYAVIILTMEPSDLAEPMSPVSLESWKLFITTHLGVKATLTKSLIQPKTMRVYGEKGKGGRPKKNI
jgi:transcriptional regulator with XRE-family HTH domain